MPKKSNLPADPAKLRHRAEVQLRHQSQSPESKTRDQKFAADPRRMLNELQVHQVELEMQNAELLEARDRVDTLLEKYTDLYEFAPVGYFSLDESGVILEANLTGSALLGVERSRLINRPLLRFVAAASQPVFLAFLKRVFAGTGKQVCEAALFKENAPPFNGSFQGIAALSVKGQKKWCRVAISDITLLKHAEAMLRRHEALFSVLIKQSPVGVYVVDGQLRLQQVNPKAQPVFSSIHPWKGRDFSEILHILWPEKIADEIMKHFRHTLKTGTPYYAPEFSGCRRDTDVTEVYEWQIQRVTLPAGELGVVCFFSDITGRKQAESAQRRVAVLAASNRKLEKEIIRRHAVEKSLKKSEQNAHGLLAQSRQMQDQLRLLSRQVLLAQEEERKRISRELHDVIAQTLTSINLRLASLKGNAAINADDLERNIIRTQKLVEHSVEIVHRFARELRPTVLDDLGLIPALHAFLKSFKGETGIQVSLSAFAGVEQVSGDQRTILYRVAQEALNNIARHAKASQAQVAIQKRKGTVCMRITDNGKGFSPTQLSHKKKRRRLGLLGMRERLEMVNGTFTIESVPGKGTTIQAEIPFARERTGPTTANGIRSATI